MIEHNGIGSIDVTLDPIDQVDSLVEDLLLVSFGNGCYVDVGWYPEMDPTGKLSISVICGGAWDDPLFICSMNDFRSMIRVIELAAEIAVGC